MIREDYLMRQIEIIARTLAKLLFDKTVTEYIITDYEYLSESDMIHSKLLRMIDEKRLNEAENLLFEQIETETEENPGSKVYLEIAIDFYSRLNELSNNILHECEFEREEIDEGLRETAEIYGVTVL